MKNVKNRILSLFLCLAFIAGMVMIPIPLLEAKAETANLAGTLGDEWSVGWNGSETPADEFVKVVTEQKYKGAYSLRIGHPQEETQLTLKLQIPATSVEAYQYAVWVKTVGTVSSVKFTARDGADGTGEGNVLEYDITGSLSTTWTQFKNIDNATEEDADGSATELTVDSGVFCVDISVNAIAGSYVYIDNLDVFPSDTLLAQLNSDSSFERLVLSNKAASDTESYNYNASEFVQIVSDEVVKANGQEKALRIGHETLDTNITITLSAPLIANWKGKASRGYFMADSYTKLPDDVDTTAEDFDISNYITTAKVYFKGYDSSTSNGRTILFNSFTPNIWKSITRSDCKDNAGTSASSSGAYFSSSGGGRMLYTFTFNFKAGVFIYLDNMLSYVNAGGDTATERDRYKEYNLFADSSFENLDFTPMTETLRKEDLPYGWTRTWDDNYDTTDYYITPNSSEGTQALVIYSKTEPLSHTVANTVKGLTVGKSYTVEATYKTYGKITSANVFFNDGTANKTIINLATASTSYKTVSGTFTPTAEDTLLNVYVNAPKNSRLFVDNIIVYETGDTTKTNLIVNGGFEPYEPTTELDYFEGALGEEWSCFENRNADIDYTKFVDVTRHQARFGSYAVRIGNPYADTDMTLRYKKNVDNGEYTYSAYLKATGTPLSGSAINLKDGESGTAVESTLTDLTETWTEYTGTVQVTDGELIIDFDIVLSAGKYLYLDYMNIVNTTSPANQINTDNSFERVIVTSNKITGYEESDFVKIVSDKSAAGDYSLRIGNPDVATDLVLEYKVAVINNTTGRSDTFRFKSDVYFEGDTTDSASYFKYGVLSGKNWRQIKVSSIAGNEWVNLNNSIQLGTSGTVNDGGPYLYKDTITYTIQIVVKCDAGEYLYLDNLSVYNTAFSSNNLIADASFENYDLKQTVFTTDTSLTSSFARPTGWSVSWSEYYGYRYYYRSNEAHSGDFALALTAKGKKMAHTYKQSISSKVEVGAEYTLEGYFKKVGTFGSVNLMETSSGLSNNSILQLKDTAMNEYTFAKGTFTARQGSNFSIYTTSGADSLLLIDDLKIYKSDDETKTNILTNGDFESWTISSQEQYRVKKTFKEAPKTFEATVKLPTDFASDDAAGVIVGNYNGKDESFNLEVTTNGNPRVYIRDTDGKSYDLVFDTVDLRTGEWTHITAVKNDTAIDLYVNGEYKASKDFTANVNTAANPYALSGDLITTNIQYYDAEYTSQPTNYNYFKGEIKNVAFYDDIRTAEEIATDVNAYGTDGLIACYDMWNLSDPEVVADGADNGYYAIRYCNFIKELQAEDDDETAFPYSMVAVGDTQYVCEYDSKYGTDDMSLVYDWILDNRENKNIQFVMGLGDITDEATAGEYAVAQKQFKKLQDANMRYSIIKGNHDGIYGYNTAANRDPALFDEYLSEGYTYDGIYQAPTFDEEGNHLSGSVDLTYHKVEVNGQKWLILALAHNASEEQFAWANEVIASHPDYRVIITVHAYIAGNRNATWASSTNQPYTGEYVWTNLASLHENVAMVLCGHSNTTDISMNKRVGVNGNVVTEMLIDRQNFDRNGAHLCHVTLLRFSADGTQVKIEDYAAGREKYFRPSNQSIVDIDPETSANDAALFNFETHLGRQNLYDNKDLAMQDLLTELKANIINAESEEAVAVAYNTAVSAVTTPSAPTVTLEGTTATITATDGYEYSMDGINWQDSPVFANLPLDTALSFYQRQSADATGYTSFTSNATLCMIVTAVPNVMVGETSIHVKPVDGYEYSLDNSVWQSSNVFNESIVNGQSYTVYMRPVGTDGYTLLLNGTTVTVNGNEPVENPSADELVKLREGLLQKVCGIDVSMDYNGDYKIDIRDLVALKKIIASQTN